MKFLKIVLTFSLVLSISSSALAQQGNKKFKNAKDTINVSDIPVEEMSFEERTDFLFDAVDANDQTEASRLAWSSAYYQHDEDGETALTKAIIQQEVEMVRMLSEKAVINLKNKDGETPLTLAIKLKNKEIIDLVAKRAKAALKNDVDEAPLWLAVENGNLFVIQKLIDNGAKVNVYSKGKTPVSRAVEVGEIRSLALLLKNGANPSLPDLENGVIPLSKAVEANDLNMAKMLLKKSEKAFEDCNWTNAIGEPVMHAAVRKENPAMVKLLLSYGAKANALNYFDATSLHLAAEQGNIELVRVLIENGANPKAENMMGETPLELAKEQEKKSIIQFLTNLDKSSISQSPSDLAGFRD